MAAATRARAAGILSLCLLLLSSVSATGALAGAANPETAAPEVVALVFGTGSCVGTDACTNAVGPIGDNSCIGDYACKDSTGSIGSGSCVGTGYYGSGGSCTGSTGNIGANSCNGDQTCGIATGTNNIAGVGDNSCNGGSACLGKAGTVGEGSCDGDSACLFSTANIGDNSCTGNSVCYSVSGPIGNDSCNGDSACNSSTSNIGNNSCNGEESCVLTSAGIGDNSCNGDGACDRISTAVGDCAHNLPGSVPAACVIVGPQPDARIRRSGGQLWGNNIYNTTAANQYVSLKIYDGDHRRVWISIQNDGSVPDSFTVCQCGFVGGGTPGYIFGYHKGHTNIDIASGPGHWEYTTPILDPGEKFLIRVYVSVDGTFLPKGVVGARLILVTSNTDAAKQDAVEIWVQRK